MTINDLLKQGLGESAIITKKKTNNKQARFNEHAYAEALTYVMSERYKQKYLIVSSRHYALVKKAHGESDESIMSKIKAGASKVYETVKKLIKVLWNIIKQLGSKVMKMLRSAGMIVKKYVMIIIRYKEQSEEQSSSKGEASSALNGKVQLNDDASDNYELLEYVMSSTFQQAISGIKTTMEKALNDAQNLNYKTARKNIATMNRVLKTIKDNKPAIDSIFDNIIDKIKISKDPNYKKWTYKDVQKFGNTLSQQYIDNASNIVKDHTAEYQKLDTLLKIVDNTLNNSVNKVTSNLKSQIDKDDACNLGDLATTTIPIIKNYYGMLMNVSKSYMEYLPGFAKDYLIATGGFNKPYKFRKHK